MTHDEAPAMHTQHHDVTVTFDVTPAVLARIDRLLDWLGGMTAAEAAAVAHQLEQMDAKLKAIVSPTVPPSAD